MSDAKILIPCCFKRDLFCAFQLKARINPYVSCVGRFGGGMSLKFLGLLCFGLLVFSDSVQGGVRLKDIARLKGVRNNQLIGYGLVVGLNGTGDSSLKYTSKSLSRMLSKMGMKLEEAEPSSKNVASVVVTATLPPFARSGSKIDVNVNSLGDAKSLRGGTLLQTPLRAADRNVYAVGQGAVVTTDNHPTVAMVSNGALVEKDVVSDFSKRRMYRFVLNKPDLTTAARVAKTINIDMGGQYAKAMDPGTIDFVVPFSWEGRGVEILSIIESLSVFPDQKAKVVVNQNTGTVVMGENVQIHPVALSHGDLTVRVLPPTQQKSKDLKSDQNPKLLGKSVGSESLVGSTAQTQSGTIDSPQEVEGTARSTSALSLPGQVSGGPLNLDAPKVQIPQAMGSSKGSGVSEVQVETQGERVHLIKGTQGLVSVGELVEGLNLLGVKPEDLIIILQSIKASGSLEADLDVL